MQEATGSSPVGSIDRFASMTNPPDLPLQRTRLESVDLAAAWEEHASEFVAWARKPGFDS